MGVMAVLFGGSASGSLPLRAMSPHATSIIRDEPKTVAPICLHNDRGAESQNSKRTPSFNTICTNEKGGTYETANDDNA